jgi:hypothetical protein
MLNWASGIWVYKDENKSLGQNRWVVMETKAKFKKPVLKKNDILNNGLLHSHNVHFILKKITPIEQQKLRLCVQM